MALLVTATLIGCRGGDDVATPVATAIPVAPPVTATETATPAPPPETVTAVATATAAGAAELIDSLHELDLNDPAVIGPLIDRAGGGVVTPERAHFADLVGLDGIDEAFVVVESGGTMGDIGVGIYLLEDRRAVLKQFIATTGRVEFRLDLVVTLEGVWATGDRQCCPSQLLERSHQWDGHEFAVLTEQLVPNPSQ